MRHELILKRESGEKAKITVNIYASSIYNTYRYDVTVYQLPKGKRKWLHIHSSDYYEWQRLDMEKRKEYEMNLYLQYVTNEEILQAKLECWQLLKPE